MSINISQYKVGVVISIEDCKKCKNSGKALRACKIRTGGDNDNFDDDVDCITVVTSAANVREGSRIVVAPAGSSYLDEEGTTQEVTKASVGGFVSQGILCDSRMLGWTGGAKGVAVQVPDTCEVGSVPLSEKPRPKGADVETASAPPAPGLFEKKLTKEEKKKLAAEKRKLRKAAKQAKAEE